MFNGHRKVGEVGMSYQSPIEVIQTQMRNQIEGNIYQAVMNVGVNVDKEELLKALQYDREQYQKGYKDRDDQIVRCKDCVHWIPGTITDKDDFIQPRCKRNGGGWSSDDYCSCAERREK